MEKIKLGVSACLLGENTRYDGRPKLNRYVRDTVGQWAEFVAVCPEVGIGLPVPREPIQLVGEPGRPRLLTRETGEELTDTMERWALERVDVLKSEDLCGFIFKARSPSCGVAGVELLNHQGVFAPLGTGIFARIFMERLPRVPVVEEGQLEDPIQREAFIRRVKACGQGRAAGRPGGARGPGEPS